jgi:hypothetical protein
MCPGRTLENLVDVGLEPLTPCLQSRLGKTLSCFVGVAYTENQRNFRSLRCPEVVPNSTGSARRKVEGWGIRLYQRRASWLTMVAAD